MTAPSAAELGGRAGEDVGGAAVVSRAPLVKLVVVGILALAAAVVLVGAQLEAQLWLIDDHAFLKYAQALDDDPDHRLAGVVRILSTHPEVVGFGVSDRYRPVYVISRVVGTAIWGTNPHAWYLASLLMFAVFLASALWVLQGLTGWLVGILLSAYLVTHQYWGDVWARLGPAEQCASVGFGLFLVGAYTVVTKGLQGAPGTVSGGVLMATGSIIAMGSKENFVILLVPVALVLAYGTYRRQLGAGATGALLVAVGVGVLIATSIALSLTTTGADYHGRSTASGARLALGLRAAGWFLWMGLGASPFIVAGGLIARRRQGGGAAAEYWRYTLGAAAIVAVLASIVIFQYVFYNGQWPTNMRYDFPGRALEPFFYAVALWYALQVRRIMRLPEKVATIGLSVVAAGLVLLVLVGDAYNSRRAILGGADRTALTIVGGIPLRQAALANTARTRQFKASLETIAVAVKGKERWPIILDSHDPWDWQPVRRISRFLAVHGVTNPLFLRLHGYPDPARRDDFAHGTLGADLVQISASGGEGGIRPLSELDRILEESQGHCFAVGFSGPALSGCTPLELSWR